MYYLFVLDISPVELILLIDIEQNYLIIPHVVMRIKRQCNHVAKVCSAINIQTNLTVTNEITR